MLNRCRADTRENLCSPRGDCGVCRPTKKKIINGDTDGDMSCPINGVGCVYYGAMRLTPLA